MKTVNVIITKNFFKFYRPTQTSHGKWKNADYVVHLPKSERVNFPIRNELVSKMILDEIESLFITEEEAELLLKFG